MDITIIINQMTVLFALMAIGYIVNKTGILHGRANRYFSSFLLKVALPATILNSALTQSHLDKLSVIYIALIAVGTFILLPFLSKIIARIFHMESTYQLMMNYSNLGFMGFPIIENVFGSEYVFYAAIFLMVFNVHIFTFGIITLQGKSGSFKGSLKKLCTPGIISALLAFILVLFPVKFPTPVTTVIASLGNITTPLAMIVIGSQLAQVSIISALKNHKLYIMSVFKLLIYPILIYGILYLLIGNTTITQISAILTALPVAGNVTMLCSEYHGNSSLSAQGTCLSTLLSLFTLPFLLILIM